MDKDIRTLLFMDDKTNSFDILAYLGIQIEYSKIIIYGSGIYGKRLLVILRMAGLFDRILGFAVSNLDHNEDVWDGFAIRSFNQYSSQVKDATVILAMSSKNANEVLESGIVQKECGEVSFFTKDAFDKSSFVITEFFSKMPINNSIFFYCYFGNGFSCNCKYIALELIKRIPGIELWWNCRIDKKDQLPKEINCAPSDTYDYYKYVYTSKIVITNEDYDDRIIKRQGQYYIMTWHGAGPFKKIGIHADESDNNLRTFLEKMYENYNLCISCNGFQKWQYREALRYSGEILESGYPRNDIFFKNATMIKKKVYRDLGLDDDLKVVLYAPTFRNEGAVSIERYDIDLNKILEALNIRFNSWCKVLYRFHYICDEKLFHSVLLEDGINVSYYPDMQELLVAADFLITDYSSSMWDFSLQRKPVFLYHGDYEQYLNDDRGFYCSPSKWPYIIGRTNEELCEAIMAFDDEKYQKDLDKWFEEYGTFDDGHASERVVDRIIEIMESD